MFKYKCPKCGSEDIQSYEAIYTGGKINHSSTTDSAFVGVESGIGRSSTTGITMSQLAQTCAPPVKNTYSGQVRMYVFLILSGALGCIHPVIGVIAFLFLGYRWYSRVSRINAEINTEFSKIYGEWQNTYYCHKCANRFIIK